MRSLCQCQLDAYGIFFAVRINPSLSNRPRLGSLWSLMPPTPAVGEQPGALTRRVGRMPARCAARDRRAGRWRAGSTLMVGDQPLRGRGTIAGLFQAVFPLGLASLSIPRWNQIMAWLREMLNYGNLGQSLPSSPWCK